MIIILLCAIHLARTRVLLLNEFIELSTLKTFANLMHTMDSGEKKFEQIAHGLWNKACIAALHDLYPKQIFNLAYPPTAFQGTGSIALEDICNNHPE